MASLFITFEGGEGTGKSTQIARLADWFRSRGRDVVSTREPGGTPAAEEIRALLVNGDPGKWTATSEALLNYAGRDQHLRDVIRPALADGKVVLCDRFMDSTRVYQGFAGGCDPALIDRLERSVVGETRPALTFIFDLDPAKGLERAKSRGAGREDRYERKGMSFHNAVRNGFLEIAKREPQRCSVIDAVAGVDEIAELIIRMLRERGHA